MKRFKKIITTIVILIIIIVIGVFVYYKAFYDPNSLSIGEREWIEENKTSLLNINIPNNLNVFGYNGSGVFFDFIEGLEKKHGITFDKVPSNLNQTVPGLGFMINKDITTSDLAFYKDHYVVISKNAESISKYSNLASSTIGVLADTLTRVTSFYKEEMIYNTYNSNTELIEALKSDAVKYLIVPKNEYLDIILSSNFKIIYHLSDLKINYYLKFGEDKTLNSIIQKYYNSWIAADYEEMYYDYAYNLYIDKLALTQAETDTLTNRDYAFGFVENTPYQTLASSNYGGIASAYLSDFSKFSGVEFTYNKYKTNEKLIRNFNKKKIDLIFNDNNINKEFYNIYTNFSNKYYIISPLNKDLILSDIKELTNTKVLVLENSKLYAYLSTIPEVQIETISNENKLLKEIKKDNIIAIDANTYDYYTNKEIENYSIRYVGYTNENYSFQYVNNNDAFYKLFNTYINSLDNNKMLNEGLISYKKAAHSGDIISIIAKYTLLIITGGLIIGFTYYYSKHRLILNTKIRKDEKLKFVDLLTSLKNRNYLNEKKDVWNQNTIYPQAVIIIDLNNVKYLNDTFGHTEGDKQIKATANILIKTQLDSTEIIRTDGNEFMVYLVGYSEKQVLNYIKKLVKEFKNLPYEYGAAFGFSMIVDDLKLIDDAINEATIQMRENKENLEANNEKNG